MLIPVQLAAVFLGIPGLLAPADLNWSEPTKLREVLAPIYIYDRLQMATASNGRAIVIWQEYNPESTSEARGDIFVRLLTAAGTEWSSPTLIGSGYHPSAAIAMSTDGSAIAAWQHLVDQPELQSQVVARKFSAGLGWGPVQVLSTEGDDPVLAIAPDGRAHIVFHEPNHGQYGAWVAKTLAPGEDVWSQTVLLKETGYQETAQLVAGNGFAYATFPVSDFVDGSYDHPVVFATYDARGWNAAVRISDPSKIGFPRQLLMNNGHAVLSWTESDTGSGSSTTWVQRLTGHPDKFTAPPCILALLSDGSLMATCETQGPAVPGCFDEFGLRSIGEQAYYRHLETYRHPVAGDWLGPEVISDLRKRTGGVYRSLDALARGQSWANAEGDLLTAWASDVPCQSNTGELLSRLWTSAAGSWQPELRFPGQFSRIYSYGFTQVSAQNSRSFRALWIDTESSRTPPLYTLWTSELLTHPAQSADVNSDGIVDCTDLNIVRASLGKKAGEPGFDARADTNQDGVVDVKDLAFVAQQLPKGMHCP